MLNIFRFPAIQRFARTGRSFIWLLSPGFTRGYRYSAPAGLRPFCSIHPSPGLPKASHDQGPNPSFILHHPSSIIHHSSSIIHHSSSIIHPPSSIIHHPSSII